MEIISFFCDLWVGLFRGVGVAGGPAVASGGRGFHGSRVWRLVGAGGLSRYGAGRAVRRVRAVASWFAQGQVRDSRSRVARAVRASRPGVANSW
jgi:hypothetical protein